MTERDQKAIERLKTEKGLNTLQAMILLVMADKPSAQPGNGGVVEEEILFLLEERFSQQELYLAQVESDKESAN